ncbi:hypothetical protein [uncultured Dubosiella sp.]|uniref:hypothetical protein n=1 Tax=uncultured Dubosiella sp. TaxID=1937011 RepID=UPI0025914DEC|nr:hypothetical protein [uncultured Dubosiella sp.]
MCDTEWCDDYGSCDDCPFHERDLDTYQKNVIGFLTDSDFLGIIRNYMEDQG